MSTTDIPHALRRLSAPSSLPTTGVGGWLRRAGYLSWLDAGEAFISGPLAACFAIALAVSTGWLGWTALGTTLLLGVMFAVAFRIELPVAVGGTVATEPVLVALAFCATPQWMPLMILAVAFCWGGREGPNTLRRRILQLGWGLNSFGLALVAIQLDLKWSHYSWGGLALAYACQVALDFANGWVRAKVQQEDMGAVRRSMSVTFAIDALLGVVGLALINFGGGTFPGLLLLLIPVLLLWLLARDRQRQYEEAMSYAGKYSQASEQARVDALTGLANRRGWEEAIERAEEVWTASQGRRTITVLLADVDYLKVANDTYGHDEGDIVIKEIGAALQEAAPPGAVVARLGGDEFGILTIGDIDEASPDLVEACRTVIGAKRTTAPVRVPLSASLGQASCPSCTSVEDAIEHADHAARLDKYSRRVQRETVGYIPADDAYAPPPETLAPAAEQL